LVAIAFLGHKPDGRKLVVDHKNLNRLNSRKTNLRIVTNRENTSKSHVKSISQYVGVGWNRKLNKWTAYIWIVNKKKYLGIFEIEHDAHLAYQKALKELENN